MPMFPVAKTLKNGLKLVFDSKPQLQTVGITFGVNFGSIDEKPQINGSAHFLEHMMFKGTLNRTWKQISDQLDELGIYNNAFTDHETTVYFMQVYRGYFEKAMAIMSDMIKNSTIPKKEFELERGPIINENLIRHDNPKFLIYDYLPRVLYRKNPAALSVGGDNDTTIARIKREDLLDIYQNNYTPQNSVLAVYGGITQKTAVQSAQKHFGNFSRSQARKNRSVAHEKQEKRILTIARKGIKQTRIGIGFKCSQFDVKNIKEYATMDIISGYLDSRLFEEIRQKRGLSYDPSASYNPYSTFGFIAAAAGVEPEKLDETKEIILKEYQKLQDGEINREDLERTRSAQIVQEKVSRDSTGGMAIKIANYELMYGGSKTLYSMPEHLSKVTLDDFRKYAHKYIDADKYGMVLMKPGK